MKRFVKLKPIITSIKADIHLWREKIIQAWHTGNQEGYGFAIGCENDSATAAILREGYELVGHLDGLAIGTNGINSIVAVSGNYGPWAVDITDIITECGEVCSEPEILSQHSLLTAWPTIADHSA